MLKWRYPRLMFIVFAMKKIFVLVVICYSACVLGQDNNSLPGIPLSGKNVRAFIPKGWKEIAKATGDLNGDGIEDVALAVEENDPGKIIKTPRDFGPETLNINYRCIIILIKEDKKFILADHSYSFLPWVNDVHSPCLPDPFLGRGKMLIDKGELCVQFHYWPDCEFFDLNLQTFKFVYTPKGMRLIEVDQYKLDRSDGDESVENYNFLTGKKSVTTGGNKFYKSQDPAVTSLEDINVEPKYLEDVSPDYIGI